MSGHYIPKILYSMKNPLCKYNRLFGEAGEKTGLRKYRIFGIALLDTFVVIAFAVLIAWSFRLSYLYTMLALFLIGIIVHRLFCVRTAVDVMIFGK